MVPPSELVIIVAAYLTASTFLLSRLLGDFADATNMAAAEVIAAVRLDVWMPKDAERLARTNAVLVPSMKDCFKRTLPGFGAVCLSVFWLLAYAAELSLPWNLGFWIVSVATLGFFILYLLEEYRILLSVQIRAADLAGRAEGAVRAPSVK